MRSVEPKRKEKLDPESVGDGGVIMMDGEVKGS